MRILSIRFRNLNSLAGDWTIDLNAAEYTVNGIFAITGPTGAGKSTILDAICLALFGSTPRLGKITAKSNEIMSRLSADCMAEVRFEAGGRRYTCCWRQNKARGKSNGKLQQPHHELLDEEGISLSSKTTEVENLVEQITGMDFERFTQSMMLAQGRFAAFLLAGGDKRADLLEQITGSRIYTDISTQVFQRCKEELARLNENKSGLDLVPLIPADAEAQMREELNVLELQASKLSLLTEQNQNALARMERIDALEKEQKKILDDQKAWQEEAERFQPLKRKLALARTALPLEAPFSALEATRKEQKNDLDELARLAVKLPPLQEQVLLKEKELALTITLLQNSRQEQALLGEQLKEVRRLDTERKAALQEAAKMEQRLLLAQKTLEEKKSLQAQHADALAQLQTALERTLLHKEAHQKDALLIEQLTGLRSRFEQMAQMESDLLARSNSLQERRQELAQGLENKKQLETHCLDLQFSLQNATDERDALLHSRSTLLCERSLSSWLHEKDALAATLKKIEKALELRTHREALRTENVSLREERTRLEERRHVEEKLLHQQGERAKELSRSQNILRDSIALLEKIRSFEEERRALEDDRPCPLCGSFHHPYALGNLPEPEGNKLELHKLEQEKTQLDADIQSQSMSLAGLIRDIEHCDERAKRLDSELACLALSLQENLLQLSTEPDCLELAPETVGEENLGEQLRRKQTHMEHGLEDIRKRLSDASALEKHLETSRRKVEELHLQQEKAQQEKAVLEQKLAVLASSCSDIEKNMEELHSRMEEMRDGLQLSLLAFGITAVTLDDMREALEELQARQLRYETFLKEEQRVRSEIYRMESTLEGDREACAGEERHAALCLEELLRKKEHCSALLRERQRLFEDKDADAEEKKAAERTAELEQKEALQRNAFLADSQKLREEEKRKADTEERLRKREAALEEKTSLLHGHMAEAGFCDEEAFHAALLPEKERLPLEEEERRLDARAIQIGHREKDCLKRLEEERNGLPDQNREELSVMLEKSRAELHAILEKRGSLLHSLEENEKQKGLAMEKRAAIERQEQEYRRWADLNELIGSSDGKKFRNYAQSLTFRLLIRHANQQLALLTDRYRLVPDAKDPLELDVIDRYQADEQRSSRNLSGGESFIVSLSLALGLAQIASRSVRVESVFLDEGFGTLDEDALNVALAMLSSLRQRGKTIGIISHVQDIRERIGTRIHVEPVGNGRSRLTGPGVHRNPDSLTKSRKQKEGKALTESLL